MISNLDSLNGDSSAREIERESERAGNVMEEGNGPGSENRESRTSSRSGLIGVQGTGTRTRTNNDSERHLRVQIDPVREPTSETSSDLPSDAFVTLNAFELVNRFSGTHTSSTLPGRFPWLFAPSTGNGTTDFRNRASNSRRRGSGDTRQNALRLRQVIRTQPRRDPSAPIWTIRSSISPSPSPYSNSNRTSKLSETEAGECWTGFGCREYPLMFEVTENDAGEFSSAYKVQNILRHDDSVFCSARRGTVVNIQLRFLGTTEQLQEHRPSDLSDEQEPCKRTTTPPPSPFLLTKMIIKAPGRGFTAPCSEGLIFISHTPILISSTQQYDHWTWIDYQSYLERPESTTCTGELSNHGSEDADGIRPAGYFRLDPESNWTQEVRFTVRRSGRDMSCGTGKRKTREDVESSEGMQSDSNITETGISGQSFDNSSVRTTNENGSVSHAKTTHARPHPYHRRYSKSPRLNPKSDLDLQTGYSTRDGNSTRDVRDIPYPCLNNGGIGNVSGRSGNYVLLKLLRADGRVGAENIDLQWVGFSGFVGGQPFSYGAMN